MRTEIYRRSNCIDDENYNIYAVSRNLFVVHVPVAWELSNADCASTSSEMLFLDTSMSALLPREIDDARQRVILMQRNLVLFFKQKYSHLHGASPGIYWEYHYHPPSAEKPFLAPTIASLPPTAP